MIPAKAAPVILFGAGRLDKGVHALEQSAHFECKKKIENLNKFVKSLNHFLNKEMITIIKIKSHPRHNKFDFLNKSWDS